MRHIRKLGSLVLADEPTGAVDVKPAAICRIRPGGCRFPGRSSNVWR